MEFKQPFKLLGLAAAAGILGALALGSPANADTIIELKTAHQNQTADFDEFEVKCGTDHQIPADKPADYDGWVFVLPKGGDAFVSVTATFEDEDGGVHVLGAEIVTNGSSGSAKHAYVGTPSGWILITAVADATGVDTTDDFNVTHTCPGEPREPGGEESSPETTAPGEESSAPGEEESTPVCVEPSAPADTESPTDAGTTAPATAGAPAESETPCEEATSPAGNGNLPSTGTPLTIALVSAAALAAGGAALFMIQRRRREAQDW